jgi:hypothetical protein
VGKQAYTLRLPKLYGRIHPTFHVSLLKKWNPQGDSETPLEPQPLNIDREEEWEVEDILAERTQQGETQYLVKWKGFPDYENSWEPEDNLVNAMDVLNIYKKQARQAAEQPR